MSSKVNLISILSLLLLGGCLPQDEQEPLVPYGGIIGSTSNSIYTHQSFFSLPDSNEVSNNLNAAWDLGFEASPNGEHVILNNSDLLRIANLGAVDFSQTTQVPANAIWLYDASSGNYDSLAIMNWVNTIVSPFEYTQNVYILGQMGEDSIRPLKKFQLIELTPNKYRIVIGKLDNSEQDTFTIEKNPAKNFVKVSIRNNFDIVPIEPTSDDWDILFTQYEDSIPDDYGVLYPYVLRGTFINHSKIKVAYYYISTNEVPANPDDPNRESGELKAYFEGNSIKPAADSAYTSEWDAIGWKWKKVTIDEAANTAIYKVDTRRIYLIKDLLNGTEYKLRFFSYYSNGVVGYPVFQYIRM
jgi:hypothetical protein